MPEMHFTVRWPEGDDMRCYSPSLVVRDHLELGRAYPLSEFTARCRTLLELASERVRVRYGFACSAALDQLAAIEARAARADAAGWVRVLAFDPPAAEDRAPEPSVASAELAKAKAKAKAVTATTTTATTTTATATVAAEVRRG
jgi:uncharacterized repeat protein (TIGR04042 family)